MCYLDLRKLCFEFLDRDEPDHVIIEFASTGQALAQEVYARYPVREQKRRVPSITPK